MNEKTVWVSLELKVADDSLGGRATYGAGTVRQFNGFMGLIGVLDSLIEEAQQGRLVLNAAKGKTDADH